MQKETQLAVEKYITQTTRYNFAHKIGKIRFENVWF